MSYRPGCTLGAVTDAPALSVVIPAHNERNVIGRTLDSLLRDGPVHPRDEIIVVANGCSDGTGDVVAEYGDPVRLLNLGVASKHAALNAGSVAATNPTCAFVDADVDVTLRALHDTVAEMAATGASVGSPELRLDLAGCSWYARAYYRLWTRLPWSTIEPVGSGVYILDRAGRDRLGAFPSATNDDQYVHDLFTESERRCARQATFVMRPPRDWKGLVARRTRALAGTRELDERFGALPGRVPHVSLVELIRRSPRTALDVPVFVAVTIAAKRNAVRKRRRGSNAWERDESSRQQGPTN